LSNIHPNNFKLIFIDSTLVVLSVDLFGTLAVASTPQAPEERVAYTLREHGVTVPSSFLKEYRSHQFDVHPAVELPLQQHVYAALRESGSQASMRTVHAALLDAFDTPVSGTPICDALLDIITASSTPSAILSNCSLTGLVPQTLDRLGIEPSIFDVILSSVDIGVRKPDPRCFDAVAAGLGVDVQDVIHVGDSPRSDGGIANAGGRFIHLPGDDWTALEELSRVVT